MSTDIVRPKTNMGDPVQLLKLYDKETIRGILIPDDWDDSNRITRMAICTADEQEYIIEMDTLGNELIALKGSRAVLQGSIVDTGKIRMTFVVERFEILPW